MKLSVAIITGVAVFVLGPSWTGAASPRTYPAAKGFLADVHEEIRHLRTLYCKCPYVRRGRSNGDVDRESCAFKSREDNQDKGDIEWEHVVPASWFGEHLSCWTQGHERCRKKDGTRFAKRKCCLKPGVDEAFAKAHNDPHNLFPAVMEVNNGRRNHGFGTVTGEPRCYGECDFEVRGRPKVAEPAESVRGEIARAMLYMMERHGADVKMSRDELTRWSKEDPPDAWECERARRIHAATGLANPFVACRQDGER